jgi:hypothetical protein
MPSLSKMKCRRSLASLVVIVAAFLFPMTVSALTLTEYQHRLKEAVTDLDVLTPADEHVTDSEFKNRLLQAIDAVRAALPEHMTIEENGETYAVDNTALHKMLEDMKSLSTDDQIKKINDLKRTLSALETRVAERIAATPTGETKEQSKLRLAGILGRPEYATGPRRGNALLRLIEDFFNWLRRFLPKPRPLSSGRMDWVVFLAEVIVIGVTAVALLYILVQVLRRFGRTRRPKARKQKGVRIVLGERLEPEATSSDLLSQAEALVRNGDVRGAIRKAYIALLVELGDRKLISLAQHKTNRDYLNSVRTLPPLFLTMRGLTDSFERHWYGLEQATPDDWQDFRAGYLAALQVRAD